MGDWRHDPRYRYPPEPEPLESFIQNALEAGRREYVAPDERDEYLRKAGIGQLDGDDELRYELMTAPRSRLDEVLQERQANNNRNLTKTPWLVEKTRDLLGIAKPDIYAQPPTPPANDPFALTPLGPSPIVGRTDEGRPILREPSGDIATERSITIPDPNKPGHWVNAPTLYGGKQAFGDDHVRELLTKSKGVDPDTGRLLPSFPGGSSTAPPDAAIQAARRRSDELGQKYGHLSGPQASAPSTPSKPRVKTRMLGTPPEQTSPEQAAPEPSFLDQAFSYLPFGGFLQSDQAQEERAAQTDLTPAPRAPEDLGHFQKGLGRGVGNTLSTIIGGSAALADVVGADDLARGWMESYAELSRDAEKLQGIPFEQALDSPSHFLGWAAGAIGEQVPVLASIAASGGLGGLIGHLSAKGLVREGLKEAAEQAAKKWAARGALGASATAMGLQEAGGIYGEQHEAGVEPQPALALAGGAVNGVLETLVPFGLAKGMGLGGRFTNKVMETLGKQGAIPRILAWAGGAAVGEGLTEELQEEVAIAARVAVDESYEWAGDEANARRLQAAATGAMVGGILGGPAGLGARSEGSATLDPAQSVLPPERSASVAAPSPFMPADLPIPDVVDVPSVTEAVETVTKTPTSVIEALPPVDLPTTTNNLGAFEGILPTPDVQGPPQAVELQEEGPVTEEQILRALGVSFPQEATPKLIKKPQPQGGLPDAGATPLSESTPVETPSPPKGKRAQAQAAAAQKAQVADLYDTFRYADALDDQETMQQVADQLAAHGQPLPDPEAFQAWAEIRDTLKAAQKSMGVAGKERGFKVFNEVEGQGGTEEVQSSKSPTDRWFKQLTTKPAESKYLVEGQKAWNKEKIERTLQEGLNLLPGETPSANLQVLLEAIQQDPKYSDLLIAEPNADYAHRGLFDEEIQGDIFHQEDVPYQGKIKEEPKPAFDYASTQFNLPPKEAQKITQLAQRIPDQDLAEDGRETQPHLTLKYGIEHDEAKQAVEAAIGKPGPIDVTLGKVSVFPATKDRPSDVVKIEVESEQLRVLNQRISEQVPSTETQEGYAPHITLGYVKPGLGKTYAKQFERELEGQSLTLSELVFSAKDGTQTTIKLGQHKQEPAAVKEEPKAEEAPKQKSTTWEGGTLYHGTGADITQFRHGEPLYLTTKSDEAMGYAERRHLGGTSGMPKVMAVQAKAGKTHDINDLIDDAINNDGEIEEAIKEGIARAKRDGARYVTYEHPPFVGEEQQQVIVSLYPDSDLAGQSEALQSTQEPKKPTPASVQPDKPDPFALTPLAEKPTKAKAEAQPELFGTGETLQEGVAPIIGREVTPEEAPLFSKTAQEEGPEQGALFEREAEYRRQLPKTETPEFKRWFGRSKVVDASGKPLVVYHGTRADFDVFDKAKGAKETGSASGRDGFFFTDSPKSASSFPLRMRFGMSIDERVSGANVIPAFLKIENPHIVQRKRMERTILDETRKDIEIGIAKNNGNDGIIFKDFVDSPSSVGGKSDVYLAFSPTQIKSAIGNQGTFDPTNPSIIKEGEVGYRDQPRKADQPSPVVREPALQGKSTQQEPPYVSRISESEGRDRGIQRPAGEAGETGPVDTRTAPRRPKPRRPISPLREGGGVRTLGKRLTKDLERVGRLDLRGAAVKNEQDLAELAQIYRNPQYETLRVWYVKDGKVVGHEGLTSRLPNVVAFAKNQATIQDYLDRIAKLKGRLEADGYYLQHNHPSGDPSASPEDKSLTAMVAERVPGFQGHVIINHGRYAILSAHEMVGIPGSPAGLEISQRLRPLPNRNFRDDPHRPHPLLGANATSYQMIAELGKRIQSPTGYTTILYRGAQGRVEAIQEVPDNMVRSKDFVGYLRNSTRDFGAVSAFAYSPSPDVDLEVRMMELVEKGVLRDALWMREDALQTALDFVRPMPEEHNLSQGVTIPQAFTRTRKVAEAEQPYTAHKQTETPEFKRWFGDSKVVDENGKPLVVYHGTTRDFTEFDPDFQGVGTDGGYYGRGFYFSSNPQEASDYANKRHAGNVKPVFVSLQNPFAIDFSTHDAAKTTRDEAKAIGLEFTMSGFLKNAEVVKERGYDGVIAKRDDRGGIEVVAFSPTQIKSAIGNQGTFDPTNPSIVRESEAPYGITGSMAKREGAGSSPSPSSPEPGRKSSSPWEMTLREFRPKRGNVVENPKSGWANPAEPTHIIVDENGNILADDPREKFTIGDHGIFYRAGKLPPSGKSYDYREQRGLNGVSVYPLPDPTSFAGLKNADWYTGFGRVIDIGSDGEPVIRPEGKWEKFHNASGTDIARDAHRFWVKWAIDNGYAVQGRVSSEYPELSSSPQSGGAFLKESEAPYGGRQEPPSARALADLAQQEAHLKKAKAGAPPRIQPDPIRGEAPKKLRDILKTASERFNQKLWKGKAGRGAAGVYKPGSKAVVLRYANDLDTAAHELGHALDDRFDFIGSGANFPFDHELSQFWPHGSVTASGPRSTLAYKRAEGVAEWVRAYLVNPTATAQQAPRFTQHVLSHLTVEVKEALEAFGRDIRVFAGATGAQKIQANLVTTEEEAPTLKERFFGKPAGAGFELRPIDRMAAKWTDRLTPLMRAYEWAREQHGLTQPPLPQDDPRVLARLLMGGNAAMDDIVQNGMTLARQPGRATPGGVDWLLGALSHDSPEQLHQELLDTSAYMIAQRTIEKAGQFKRTGHISGIGGGISDDVTVAQDTLTELARDPARLDRLKETAARYRQWATANLDYLLEHGRISQEQYDGIIQNNEYYVAMKRLREITPDEEIAVVIPKSTLGRHSNIGAVKQPIQGLKGSDLSILDPFEQLLNATNQTVREADRNHVLRTFVELLEDPRGMYQGQPKDLASVARKAKEGEPHTIPVYRNGEKEIWQFHPDVYKALKGIGDAPVRLPAVLTMLPRILRTTIVNAPPFALRNVIRDAFHRTIISNVASKPWDTLKRYTATEIADLRRFGGDQAGHYYTDEQQYMRAMKAAMEELSAKPGNVVALAHKLGRGYLDLMQASERQGRLAEYRRAYRQATTTGVDLGDGTLTVLDPYNAGLYAAKEARGLIDYAVAGEYMNWINQLIPFSNAAVQGLRVVAKQGAKTPSRLLWRTMLYAAIPSLLNWLWNWGSDDLEEYRELPAYQRDLFWNFKLGPDLWLRIPKPFELGMIGSTVERTLDRASGNEKAFDDHVGQYLHTLAPIDEGALAGPFQGVVQAMTNYDLFRQRNIVPPWEQDLELGLRKTWRASRLGQVIQEAIGVDARKIDFLARQQFGYFGQYATRLSDLGRPEARSLGLAEVGITTGSPAAASLDVAWVLNRAKERGAMGTKEMKAFRKHLDRYYDAPDREAKEAAASILRFQAARLRARWERRPPRSDAEEKRAKKLLEEVPTGDPFLELLGIP